VKAPLIVYDPASEADATRGTVCDELVEGIDLAATFIEAAGGEVPDHIVEGRSLMPFLQGRTPETWRDYVISEYDYSVTRMAATLGVEPRMARLFMVADKRWKFVYAEGFRPMLFDLQDDPNEYRDLGDDDEYEAVRQTMMDRLCAWARRPSQRTTRSNAVLKRMRAGSGGTGVLLGLYDGSEVPSELTEYYRGKPGR
jgi:arylsulfatase A-like enzyme